MGDGGKIKENPGLNRNFIKGNELHQNIYDVYFERIVDDIPVSIKEEEKNL